MINTCKTAKLIFFKVGDITIIWQCPYCGNVQEDEYPINPYRNIAENMPEEQCNKCKKFVSLTLYEK